VGSERHAYKLGELVDIKHGFAFKSENFSDEPSNDILLTPGNFAIGGGFKYEKLKYFSGDVSTEFILQAGDLLVTMTDLSKQSDTLGYPALVPDTPGKRYLHNQRLGLIKIRSDAPLEKLYLYYLMCSREYRNEIIAGATGTTVKHTAPERIKAFAFLLPSQKEQHAIAHILGSIDDKIELNRQMNETLEAMARTIFKSWFVDFDPVRAKAEGRDPDLPKEIADLFPGIFGDSGLGEIPRGWEVARVEEIAEKVACGPFGSSIKVSTFVAKGVPVISGQHLHGIRLLDEGNNFITPEHAEKLKNANVFRGDVILTHAGNIGQVAFIPETSKYNRYVLSQRQFYLRCNEEIVSPIFMAHYFKSSDGQHQLLANTSSTGVPSISRPVSYLKSIKFTLPPKTLIDRFNDFVQPLHVFAAKLEAESQILTFLRDTLLPKLISGELRIPDVGKFIKEAGI